MATPQKNTAKAPAKKSTRTTAKKRTAKKPKVRLSAQKVFLLSGVIVLLCAVSLAVSAALATPKAQKAEPPAIEPQPSAQTVVPTQQPVTTKPQPQHAAEAKTQTAQPKAQTAAGAPTQTVSAPSAQKPVSAPSAPQKDAVQSHAAAEPTAKPTAAPQTQPVLSQTPSGAVASAKAEKPAPAKPAVTQSVQPEKPQPPPQEKKSPFTIPPARNGATLVFVIDDAGLHVDNVKKYTALPFPLAIAVLPRLAQSKACAVAVRADGKELMLHQPMQAHAYASGTVPDPGKGAILPDMNTAQITATIHQNLDELGPGVKGFNNHEGSLITESEIKMGAVLEVAAERGVYFLDSRTTSQSAVPQAALERDLPYIARYAPFLDNTIDRAAMLAELYKGLEVANKNGYAVIIGHVDKSVKILPQLLADIYPYLVQAGYRFATPSQLR